MSPGISRLRPTVQLEEPKTKSGVTIFESTDAGEEDVLICAFRGSANLQNFATNLRLSLVPLQGHPSARVHAGFQEAAQGLWALLEPELARIDADGRNRRAVLLGTPWEGRRRSCARWRRRRPGLASSSPSRARS
jgi:hypothetical protein